LSVGLQHGWPANDQLAPFQVSRIESRLAGKSEVGWSRLLAK
jgi:hypothetical protein